MRKNRNGFTLVELLLVIGLLAIIIAITIPLVVEIAESSRRKAFYLYGLNLVQKATEKYVSTYTNLDDYSYDEWENAACVTYNIATDLSIKNTGDYQGWAQIRRSSSTTTDSDQRIGIVKFDITPSATDNQAYFDANGRYMDGLLYPKYCIGNGTTCTPEKPINVQENQYTLEVKKTLDKNQTLCVNYQKAQKIAGKDTLVNAETKCITYDDTTAAAYVSGAAVDGTNLIPLPTDYKYEVILTYIDNSYVIENINMEGITEKEFIEQLDAEMQERASYTPEEKLVITNPTCKPGETPTEELGRRTFAPTQPTIPKTTKEAKNVQLKSLTISNVDISFNPGQLSYSVEVPNSINSVRIHAEPEVETTKVTYTEYVDLSIGRNVISISLEDIDGESNRYIIYINRLNTNTTRTTISTTTTTRSTRSKGVVIYTTREITTAEGAPDPSLPESNAQLEFLTISKHQDFTFNPDTYYYDLKIDKDEDMLYLNYRAKNPNATVIVTGNSNLKNGSQVEILVRSENEYYTKSYIINIYREGNTVSFALLFRIMAIVLGILLALILVWLTLARRSMRPKKEKRIQVITKTTQQTQTTSVFDSTPKKVVINTNQNNDQNNDQNNNKPN